MVSQLGTCRAVSSEVNTKASSSVAACDRRACELDLSPVSESSPWGWSLPGATEREETREDYSQNNIGVFFLAVNSRLLV